MTDLAAKRRERGEATETDLAAFARLTETELLTLLHSEISVERTCAATHLQQFQNASVVSKLCQQLCIEKKLYTKIALSETLATYSELAVTPLINLLGKIGKNQESKIPETGFYKTSYPLPRDLAARTLCRLGADVLTSLEDFMTTTEYKLALLEAIDAYGHIVYTDKIDRPSYILRTLVGKHPDNSFSRYKIVRCLSGFHDEWAQSFLLETIQVKQDGLRVEALRSLLLSGVEIPESIQETYSPEMQNLAIFLTKTLHI